MTAESNVPMEELLAQRAWVRALARRLVADESGADDLEQDVWVRALSRPPQSATSLRGWFRRVVRSAWIDAHRTDAQRSAREVAVARREDHEDDVVAQADAHRRVVQAAYALPEPYRTTLLLRYFEGLSLGDVARRTGVPKETVHTRLRRALVLMRSQLDVEMGDREAWCAALVPLALGTGGMTVKASSKTGLAAAVLLALGAGTLWWVGGPAAEERTRVSPAEAVASVEPRKHAALETTAPNPFPGDASIRGEVRRIEDRAVVPGATVLLEDRAGRRSATATADSSGRFAFPSVAPGLMLHVHAETPQLSCVARRIRELRTGEVRDVGVVWLDGRGELDVHLETAGGSPEGAAVEVFSSATSRWGTTTSASAEEIRRFGVVPLGAGRADATGHVRLRVAAAMTTVVVRHAGYVTAACEVDVRSGRTSRASVVLVPGTSIRGRLVDGDGQPLRDHTLLGRTDPSWGTVTALYAKATTDADGCFEIQGLQAGPGTLLLETDQGPIVLAMVRAPSADRFEFVVRWTLLEGTVTCVEDGRAVPGATVRTIDNARSSSQATVLVAHADEQGRYRIATVGMAVFVGLQAEAPGLAAAAAMRPEDAVFVAAGATARRDLAVTRASSVEGRVLCGKDGVPAADVAAYWTDGAQLARCDTTTDAEGAYRIDGVPPNRTVIVEVHAPGISQDPLPSVQALFGRMAASPAWSVVAEPGKTAHLDVQAKRGRSVAGRVEDQSGAPVPSASVYGGNERTVTADDGTFRLVGAPRGPRSSIGVRADGFTYAVANLAEDGDVADLRIVVHRAPHLRGSVRTDDGTSLPSGTVVRVVSAEMLQGHYDSAMAWRSAWTYPVRADGTFDIAPVFAGELRLRADAPHFVQQLLAVTLRDADVAGLELVLSPATRLEGRIVDATSGEPISGARVEMDLGGPQPQNGPRYERTPSLTAVSDANGAFAANDVPPGTYPVTVTADGRVKRMLDATMPLSAPLDVRLERSAPFLAGIVLASDRKPVGGVSISVRPDHPENGGEGDRWTRTGEDGRFEIAGSPARGTWTVSAYPPQGRGFPNTWVKLSGVEAGRRDVELSLGKALRIAGRVVGSDGLPALNIEVSARSHDRNFGSGTTTDGTGAFAVEGVEEGRYELYAGAPDERHEEAWASVCRDLPTTVTDIEAGREDVVVRLEAGASISGVLVGEDGRPVSGAWITTSAIRGQGPPRSRPGHFPCAGRTDAEGRFTIGGLFPMRYRLMRVEGSAPSPTFTPLADGEDVVAGTTGVRLRIPPTGTISGRVVDESGKPVADVHVGAMRGNEGFAGAASGPDGTFELSGLDALQLHVVEASKPGVFAVERSDPVRPGARDVVLRMRRGLHATGRVVDAEGKPVGRVSILRFIAQDGSDFAIKTDDAGRFDVWGLAEGSYRVLAQVVQTASGKVLNGTATLKAGDKDVDLRFE
jgi:RNA polymerase sigma factor (sigma-70 family)